MTKTKKRKAAAYEFRYDAGKNPVKTYHNDIINMIDVGKLFFTCFIAGNKTFSTLLTCIKLSYIAGIPLNVFQYQISILHVLI